MESWNAKKELWNAIIGQTWTMIWRNICQNASNAKCPRMPNLRKLLNFSQFRNVQCQTNESTWNCLAYAKLWMLETTSSPWQMHSLSMLRLWLIQTDALEPEEEEEGPDWDLYTDEPPLQSSSEESNPALRQDIETESDFNFILENSNSKSSARISPTDRQALPP